MDMRITDSVGEAIDFVMRLAHGVLKLMPSGFCLDQSNVACQKALDGTPFVEKPDWDRFSFFTRIASSDIRTVGWTPPVNGKTALGRTEYERMIDFYLGDRLVASATMVGVQFSSSRHWRPDDDNRGRVWAVQKLRYLDFADENYPSKADEEAFGYLGKWKEVDNSNWVRLMTIRD